MEWIIYILVVLAFAFISFFIRRLWVGAIDATASGIKKLFKSRDDDDDKGNWKSLDEIRREKDRNED